MFFGPFDHSVGQWSKCHPLRHNGAMLECCPILAVRWEPSGSVEPEASTGGLGPLANRGRCFTLLREPFGKRP
jgi:hypothetical protein